jgi:hypothetical protein
MMVETDWISVAGAFYISGDGDGDEDGVGIG